MFDMMKPEMKRYTVVIIGGSLAGSTCARALLDREIEAIAFERDEFPREKVCGEFLSPGGIKLLEELGLLNQVMDFGAVSIRRARVRGWHSEFEIPFDSPGLGISRKTLDFLLASNAPVQQHTTVLKVERERESFVVTIFNKKSNDQSEIICPIVVDAAGKLSRFTKKAVTEEFGVQCHEVAERTDTVNFWFFADAYGGTISVDGNRKNICYLVKKSILQDWLKEREWLVTGPLAYERLPGPYITIGDACGMVDPFCGDGMRHALSSGIMAAKTIADGIRRRLTYDQIRCNYEWQWEHRWSRKRILSSVVRATINYPQLARPSFALAEYLPQFPSAFLRTIWK